MKIRDPRVIRGIGVIGSHLVKHWVGTLDFHLRFREPESNPTVVRRSGQRYIYAFFHENILFPARYWNWPSMNILISEHADGEIITQIVKRLGFGVVRGSSTRGSRPWKLAISASLPTDHEGQDDMSIPDSSISQAPRDFQSCVVEWRSRSPGGSTVGINLRSPSRFLLPWLSGPSPSSFLRESIAIRLNIIGR